MDPDHLEAEDFEPLDEDSDRDQQKTGQQRPGKQPQQQQLQQQSRNKQSGKPASGRQSEGTAAAAAAVATDETQRPSGVSASKAKRMEKKANKASGSSNSGKQYTEEDRAAMIQQMNETKRYVSPASFVDYLMRSGMPLGLILCSRTMKQRMPTGNRCGIRIDPRATESAPGIIGRINRRMKLLRACRRCL